MSEILVTVLMSVYNADKFLCLAIDSILNQSFRNFELIAIDDGSTDTSSEILENYRDIDSRVRVVTQKNSGIVNALNVGLDLARGTYIARMDADDISLPSRLQTQVDFLNLHPKCVVVGSSYELMGDAAGRVTRPRTNYGCLAALLLQSCFGHPTVMMRASVLRLHGIRYEPDFQYAEDYRLWTVISAFGELSNVEKPLLRYRIHDNQIRVEKSLVQRRRHTVVASKFIRDRTGLSLSAPKIYEFIWGRNCSLFQTANRLSTGLRLAYASRRIGVRSMWISFLFVMKFFFRPV